MVRVGGAGRVSFSGRAPLFGPTTTPPPPPPNSLSNARARAFCQIKESVLRRTSDNWTFAKEREIFRRSPLRVVRNEAEPFCVLSRRRDDSRARAYGDFSNDRTRVSARARCGALLRVLQVARARTAKAKRARTLSRREKKGRAWRICRAR